ncbi:MAG: hypothetical protein ABJH45_06665 [Paracoccaceae bacterium]
MVVRKTDNRDMYTDSWSLRSAVSLWSLIAVGVLGTIAAGWIASRIVPAYLVPVSFVGFLAAIGMRALWMKRRLKENLTKGAELQGQLHELEKQEFEMRYADARARGDFDKWEEDK